MNDSDNGTSVPSPLSPLRIVAFALRYRVLIFVLPLALASAIVVWGLFQGRSYTSAASFVPMTASGAGSQQMLSGLAAQIGVVLPTQGASQSPEFYIYLLRSQPVLAAVASASFRVTTDSGLVTGDLMTLWRAPGETPQTRLAWTVLRLNETLSAVPGVRTGVVRFTVRSRYPDLSQQIAAQFLERLDAFNRKGRQSRASAERQFVEDQLAAARRDLATAEQYLLAFSQRNRLFESSSELAVRRDRLYRDVTMRQQVYTSLAQAYEQSKIEEVRDTPVLSILEPPIAAARPDSRGLAVRGILLTMFGVVLGTFVALVREYTRHKAGDSEMIQVRSELRALLRRRRRPLAGRTVE